MLVHHKFCLIDAEPLQQSLPQPKQRRFVGLPALEVPAVVPCEQIRLPRNGVLLNGSMNWTMQVRVFVVCSFLIVSSHSSYVTHRVGSERKLGEYYHYFIAGTVAAVR